VPRPIYVPRIAGYTVWLKGAGVTEMALPDGGRLNNGLLQPLERPALQWLAARMPQRVTPDHLTAVGVLGALIGFAGYALSSSDAGFLWLASVGLVVNWFGDSLDGTLARFRRIERPRYGYFVDKTTDMVNDALFALGLGLSSFIRFEVACLALIVYLMITSFTFVKTEMSGTIQIAFGGIGPTEVRVGMAILNLSLFLVPPKPILTLWAPLNLPDLCVLAATAAGFVLYLHLIRNEARRLAVEDPPPAGHAAKLERASGVRQPQ
jgi:archaetidylinositol phosphate synthase